MNARRLTAFVAAGVVAAQVRRALVGVPALQTGRWRRTNFHGREVDVLGGPAAVAGLVAGVVCSAPAPAAPLIACVGAGALGAYDDLAGSTHARGLRGHLEALRSGVVTTGMVKMVGLAGTAVAAAAVGRRRHRDVLLDTVLIAGSANLVNLLDLRPGRALKVVLATSALTAGGGDGLGAVCAGCAVALLPSDLGEVTMLGDCGANALGAALGWTLSRRPTVVRLASAAVVVGLTLASEKVSFSTVIDDHALLATVDRWGRLPS